MMHQRPVTTRLHLVGAALAGCLWLVACSSLNTGNTGPPFRDPTMSMQTAQATLVVGKSTQTEVAATLGPATNIQFDSGNAIWVYRTRPAESEADRAELVILFNSTGVVKKTRLRPAYRGYAR